MISLSETFETLHQEQRAEIVVRRDREDLYKQIRKIRDTFGDDKCWKDWEALFKMLPEGYTPPMQDIAVALKHCEKYLKCQSEYIPPPRWVMGQPDKNGLWVVKLLDGWQQIINWTENSKLIEGSNTIIYSFGPIPGAPCL